MMALTEWRENSRAALERRLAYLRARLDGQSAAGVRPQPDESSALGVIVRRFGLTGFESDILVAAAGIELDAGFAGLVANLQGTARPAFTFALAFSLFEDPHWSSVAPAGVLRQARLLRLGEGAGLVDTPLQIEEPVLHSLNGVAVDPTGFDSRLRPYFRILRPAPVPASLRPAAEQLVRVWAELTPEGRRSKPHLSNTDTVTARALTAGACAALEKSAVAVEIAALPADRAQAADLVELMERDCVLFDTALLFETGGCESLERKALIPWLAGRVRALSAFAGDNVAGAGESGVVQVPVPLPSRAEQESAWRDALGPAASSMNGRLSSLVEQFRLSPSMLDAAAVEALAAGENGTTPLADRIWNACRRRARGGLDDIAQRVESRAAWNSLVLPQAQIDTLRSLVFSVRHRHRVREEWGFERSSSRGVGTTALFFGPSGSGKTLAAEVVACELKLDLYRIDLSATVSKYIGETEKNLRRVFDAAESSGAILLFDEADALFGKRSEVQNSHDRYANIEVSYLLQRLEAYRGLAILTTNLKSAIDSAFLRRLQYVVPFPFPPAPERARIWRCALPDAAPLDPAVDFERLSQLAVAGGNIANIALDAAYRAAAEGESIRMRHLLDAARAECAKIEKPLADAEVRGWI